MITTISIFIHCIRNQYSRHLLCLLCTLTYTPYWGLMSVLSHCKLSTDIELSRLSKLLLYNITHTTHKTRNYYITKYQILFYSLKHFYFFLVTNKYNRIYLLINLLLTNYILLIPYLSHHMPLLKPHGKSLDQAHLFIIIHGP